MRNLQSVEIHISANLPNFLTVSTWILNEIQLNNLLQFNFTLLSSNSETKFIKCMLPLDMSTG
jgi:hypothetical protein